MITYKPMITDIGIQKAINDNNDGVAFKITHVSFGGSKFEPTGKETTLNDERVKVQLSSSARVNDTTFKIRARVRSEVPFYCQSIGFWCDDVLFAVFSSLELPPTGIFNIHNSTDTVVAYSLSLDKLGADKYEVILTADEDYLNQLISMHEDDSNAHGLIALKELINSKVGNEKKSSSITSSSVDTVATSKAVKTVNDKIERNIIATSKAQQRADSAYNLANTKENKITRSNSVTSSSTSDVATSLAVKTVNDKANKLEQNKLDKSALSSSVTSTDETKASTPKATKTAYDKAVQANKNADSRVKKSSNLNKSNLNDITEEGFHLQDSSANATISNNYPEKGKTGSLLVEVSPFGVMQTYTHHLTGDKWWRGQTRDKGWTKWIKIIDYEDYINTKSEVRNNGILASKAQQKADSAYSLANTKENKITRSDSVTSSSSINVATSKAVKTAYDKAVQADNNANTRVSKNGDTMTGNLVIRRSNSDYSEIILRNNANKDLYFGGLPDNDSSIGNIIYRDVASFKNISLISIPKKNGTLALRDESVPVGSIQTMASDKRQKGYLKCDGGLYSTTTYAELFKEIGYTWGGSGSRFAVPNLTDKARFLRSSGNGLKVGTYQNDAIRDIRGSLFGGERHDHQFLGDDVTGSGCFKVLGKGGKKGIRGYEEGLGCRELHFTASSYVPTADENRPYACVVAYWIKY